MKKHFIKRTIGVLLAAFAVLAFIASSPLEVKAAGDVDGFVERCYTVSLNRGSDPGGFAFWTEKLGNGELTAYSLVYNFIFSDEYVGKNKSDADFVEDLYLMFMGRQSDSEGKAFWLDKLNNKASREEVFAGFAVSPEFSKICASYNVNPGYFTPDIEINRLNNLNNFVSRMYQTTLGRCADYDGQKFWVENLANGNLTACDVAANFILGAEFQSKKISNLDYLDVLYHAFMGRNPDPEGLDNWNYKLEENYYYTREDVFQNFLESEEFTSICALYEIKKGSYTAPLDYRRFYEGSELSTEEWNEPVFNENHEIIFYRCVLCKNYTDGLLDTITTITYGEDDSTYSRTETDKDGNLIEQFDQINGVGISYNYNAQHELWYIDYTRNDIDGNGTRECIQTNPDGNINSVSYNFDYDDENGIHHHLFESYDYNSSTYSTSESCINGDTIDRIYILLTDHNRTRTPKDYNDMIGALDSVTVYDKYGNVISRTNY